jgi:hypothetical protein
MNLSKEIDDKSDSSEYHKPKPVAEPAAEEVPDD